MHGYNKHDQNLIMNPTADRLIWLDLEMTGLDTTRDHIIEIATVITDTRLQIVAQGPVFAIHQTDEVLAGMDQWNVRQHTSSGLIERVKASQVTEQQAENETLEFISRYVLPNKSPICGNSICQDRRFLFRWMPKLEQFFHYRNFDVSTLKEIAYRWKPEIMKELSKRKSKHLALEDIRDSIEELRYYLQHLMNVQ
jgi:oligoribonuclease